MRSGADPKTALGHHGPREGIDLRDLHVELDALKTDKNRSGVDALQAAVDQIEKQSHGSFMANPVLRALLIPGGGIGILQIAEALARQ